MRHPLGPRPQVLGPRRPGPARRGGQVVYFTLRAHMSPQRAERRAPSGPARPGPLYSLGWTVYRKCLKSFSVAIKHRRVVFSRKEELIHVILPPINSKKLPSRAGTGERMGSSCVGSRRSAGRRTQHKHKHSSRLVTASAVPCRVCGIVQETRGLTHNKNGKSWKLVHLYSLMC